MMSRFKRHPQEKKNRNVSWFTTSTPLMAVGMCAQGGISTIKARKNEWF